jgi:hypothetical protein
MSSIRKAKAAGLIFESNSLYLDHLAPFCALLRWPLIIVDPSVRILAKRFYPDLEIIPSSITDLGEVLRSFTHLVSCATRPLLFASLGPISAKTIWLPHGNSDKGRITPFFQAIGGEELALIYGQKMADVIKESNAAPPMIRIGQYRYLYYQKWRSFYDALPIVKFAKKQPTILYAPTWEDAENNCSFWKSFERIAREQPESINLIVKLHPNTIIDRAPELERLIGKSENGRLQFLFDFPPIVPLLNRCDYYLGDRSSIGYDFLRFDRPLFFLDPHDHREGRDLTCCGTTVTPESFYHSLTIQDCFSTVRRKMLAYTFDEVPISQMIKSIHFFCRAQRGQNKNGLQIH